ncbi:MAG: outer membrane lipid asymmetry maintenance protein MlaD [Azospirillaceae bacterium]|nr:outer membrane lipid asymmetry maintenance protein MlaD [Azospirillaceae bacterium]
MRRNVIETVLGGVVLAVAAFFLVFAYTSADLRSVQGYDLNAQFSSVAGLQAGGDVRVSGVKIGTVVSKTLDPKSFLAVVHFSVDPAIKLPRDTVAVIASESLLGGKFLELDPGGDSEVIPPGGRVEYTQSTPGLEQLLGQAIYSYQQRPAAGGEAPDDGAKSAAGPAPAAKPAANPAPAPTGGLLGH